METANGCSLLKLKMKKNLSKVLFVEIYYKWVRYSLGFKILAYSSKHDNKARQRETFYQHFVNSPLFPHNDNLQQARSLTVFSPALIINSDRHPPGLPDCNPAIQMQWRSQKGEMVGLMWGSVGEGSPSEYADDIFFRNVTLCLNPHTSFSTRSCSHCADYVLGPFILYTQWCYLESNMASCALTGSDDHSIWLQSLHHIIWWVIINY